MAFSANPCRLGKRTDFEALDLEIWTDGSISPELALVEATNILRKHLNPFVKYFEIGRDLDTTSGSDLAIEGDAERSAMLVKQINALDLSVKAENALRAANIRTLADLVQLDEGEIGAIRNLGKIATKEIKKKLADRGLSFGMRLVKKADAAG
jgi:DNA-directed RNA polymerase subunit alpha